MIRSFRRLLGSPRRLFLHPPTPSPPPAPSHSSPKIYPTAVVVEECDLEMGDGAKIGDFCLIALRRLRMGKGAQINSGAKLTGMGRILMGDFSTVGFDTHLLTATDTLRGRYMNDAAPQELRSVKKGLIHVGEGAFIGDRCTVMPGVTIGRFAVIGSGTYLDKDVEAETVVRPEQQLVVTQRDA